MTFVPKGMQFEPMNKLYEDGMNPWSVHQYDNGKKVVIKCGSETDYKNAEIHGILPQQIKDYLKQFSDEVQIFIDQYPGSLITRLRVTRSNDNKWEVDYAID